jgi:hypothetical protein
MLQGEDKNGMTEDSKYIIINVTSGLPVSIFDNLYFDSWQDARDYCYGWLRSHCYLSPKDLAESVHGGWTIDVATKEDREVLNKWDGTIEIRWHDKDVLESIMRDIKRMELELRDFTPGDNSCLTHDELARLDKAALWRDRLDILRRISVFIGRSKENKNGKD